MGNKYTKPKPTTYIFNIYDGWSLQEYVNDLDKKISNVLYDLFKQILKKKTNKFSGLLIWDDVKISNVDKVYNEKSKLISKDEEIYRIVVLTSSIIIYTHKNIYYMPPLYYKNNGYSKIKNLFTKDNYSYISCKSKISLCYLHSLCKFESNTSSNNINIRFVVKIK